MLEGFRTSLLVRVDTILGSLSQPNIYVARTNTTKTGKLAKTKNVL